MKRKPAIPIKIDKGVPMPDLAVKKGGTLTNMLRQLEVGDSFIKPKQYNINTVYSVANYIGIRLARRTMPDGTLRFWRVK